MGDEGNILKSSEETVERWRKFLQNKFKATPEEGERPELENLLKTVDKLTWKEFGTTVKRLDLGKTTVPDGIPSEVYKFCPTVRNELFHLISYVWDEEVNFVTNMKERVYFLLPPIL